MNKDYCEEYCGINCITNCPKVMHDEYPDIYESVSSCKECFYYKGCEDCCFSDTEYCDKFDEKEETNNESNM